MPPQPKKKNTFAQVYMYMLGIVFFDNFQSVSRKFGIFESHSNNNNIFNKDILNFGAFYYVTKVTESNGLL